MITTNEKQFRATLRAASREVPGMHLAFQKLVAVDALRRIVLKTPVDTGRARGSIQAGGTTNETVLERTDRSGGTAISIGTNMLNRITKPFGIMFVFSNLSYIVPLEEGHSIQAPSGMFATTRAALLRVSKIAGLLNLRFKTR